MDLSFLSHLLNGLLMVALGAGLGIFLYEKFRLDGRLWWIGAAAFILSQVGHIPFNSRLLLPFLDQTLLPAVPAAWQTLLLAVTLGLSAGLFEEIVRYGTFRWFAKQARSWRPALLLGAGHGGAEAIILGVLVLVALFQISALEGKDLAALIPEEYLTLAQQQIEAYWSSPWYANLLGALERAFTLVLHVSFAVLILQVFQRSQGRWLWLAVGWHALVDAAIVVVARQYGVYAAEAVLFGLALIGAAIIFALRRPEPSATESWAAPDAKRTPEAVPAPAQAPERPTLPALEESPESLESTRYQS